MERLDDIIYEEIDHAYARGKYGEFEVVLMKRNHYINATKLVALGGKRFDHWLENKNSKALVETVRTEITLGSVPGIPGTEGGPFIIVKGGQLPGTQGTYVHPLLVPHIACWAGPPEARLCQGLAALGGPGRPLGRKLARAETPKDRPKTHVKIDGVGG